MSIEEGVVVNGKITGITDFGAFMEIEGGKTGMIHISHVSAGFVKDIKDHLQVGQEVTAKVIKVSPEGKISLSIKELEQNSEKKGEKPQRSDKGDRSDKGEKKPYVKRDRPAPNVWTGQKSSAPTGEKQSFEDMMASFKKASDEKMSDLKRTDAKRGSVGYSRRGKN